MFHGVGFQEKPSYHRTIAQAVELCEEIGKRRAIADVPCRPPDAPSPGGPRRTAVGRSASPNFPISSTGEPLPLLSFEDHSPGQGQFRDLEKFKRSVASAAPPVRSSIAWSLRTSLNRRLGAACATPTSATSPRLAGDGRVRLLAHDLEDAGQVAEAAGWGAAVAEFPLTADAAAEARNREMPVVLGAPNVLRRGSHSGNVSAEQLIAQGLCTSLASDYQPATLLAAAFGLAGRGTCSLPSAVALVTSGAATVAGLHDRGSLRVGARADLALVALDGAWPRVRQVWRAR